MLGLDFLYKAFTTTDIAAAIGGVRALGIRGCSVSMPFKQDVLALVDVVEPSAQAIESVNTIVNDTSVPGGRLTAANTDYLAVRQLIARYALDPGDPVVIRGSGGMARAVGAAFVDAGFTTGVVVARNRSSGEALAGRLGYSYTADVDSVTAPILVNVTPIGMAGGPEEHELAFGQAAIGAADTVFDVVALPSETPLIAAASGRGEAGHHRRAGDRAAGRRTVRALHRGASEPRADRRGLTAVASLTGQGTMVVWSSMAAVASISG